MSGPAHLYAPILGLGTLLALALAAYGWRNRHLGPGGAEFTVFNLGVAVWTGVYILELDATGPAALFWANLAYFGIVLLPASWLVFAFRYSGHEQRITRRLLALLCIEPLATVLLVWTNPWHQWFRKGVQVEPTWTPGPAFWLHAGYSYALLAAGTVLIARRVVAGPRLGRGQGAALLIAALAPWAANAIYLSGRSPFGNLDPSPFGFGLTSLAAAWVLYRELQLRLVTAERRFRALVDHSIDTIEIIDAETGRLLDVNERACVTHGYSREDYRGLFAPEIDPAMAGHSWQETRDRLRRQGPNFFESEHRRKDGSTFPVEVNATHVSLDRDYVLAVVRDITERKRAEQVRDQLLEDLRSERQQLAALSRRLVVVQEEERRAIARELHDQIGQLLTGLKLLAESDGGKDELLDVVGELIGRVRSLSLDLRPPMLDTLGLVPALLWHLDRYTAQTGVRVDFRERGQRRRYASNTEIAAFRIVQEALTNVARHAGVREASIRIEIGDEGGLRLRVEDQGSGFDTANVFKASSIGLIGIHERADLLGGRVSIDSGPGRGTRVEAELPATSREPAA